MTTKKIFEEDVYRKELDTTVVRVDRYQDRPALVLSETIFFPQGGGQPWDLGTVDQAALAGVVEEDGVIYHLLDTPAPDAAARNGKSPTESVPVAAFHPGQPVHLSLDWERRFDHMQRHCGEHILSGIFFREYGGVNRGFHMGEEYMTIDISLERNPDFDVVTWEMAEHAELQANRAIWQDLPVTVTRYRCKEDAAGIPLRKELAIDADISIVCVGSQDNPSDCVACCGTHPATSGQVGLIKIFKVEHYKGMFRIYFEAGERALSDYRAKHNLITALGNKFSAGTEDLLDKLEAREAKNSDTRAAFYKLRQSVAEDRLAEITAAMQSPATSKVLMTVRSYDDLPPDDLLAIGRRMTGNLRGLLILHYPTERTLFLFSDGNPDCGKLVRNHLDIYNGKGGGNATGSRIIFSKPEYPDLFIDLLEKHLR